MNLVALLALAAGAVLLWSAVTNRALKDIIGQTFGKKATN